MKKTQLTLKKNTVKDLKNLTIKTKIKAGLATGCKLCETSCDAGCSVSTN